MTLLLTTSCTKTVPFVLQCQLLIICPDNGFVHLNRCWSRAAKVWFVRASDDMQRMKENKYYRTIHCEALSIRFAIAVHA